MLSDLSPVFDPMIMAIESSGAKITSDFVKGKLLQEDVKKCKDSSSSADTAFHTKSKGKSSEKRNLKDWKRKPKKDFKCFVCNEPNHRALDCPKNPNKPNAKKDSKGTAKKDSKDSVALLQLFQPIT